MKLKLNINSHTKQEINDIINDLIQKITNSPNKELNKILNKKNDFLVSLFKTYSFDESYLINYDNIRNSDETYMKDNIISLLNSIILVINDLTYIKSEDNIIIKDYMNLPSFYSSFNNENELDETEFGYNKLATIVNDVRNNI